MQNQLIKDELMMNQRELIAWEVLKRGSKNGMAKDVDV